jgi:hypothetical protein
MSLITVIGRGHSGTRAVSHTLSASGVFMGSELNPSGDKVPPQEMYEACRVIARKVTWKGGLEWDFSGLHDGEIDPEFIELVNSYLRDVFENPAEHKGWKIPETTLCYPWIQRMFPDIRYIFWLRDPRDCILGRHLTDDLADFGIEYPRTDDVRRRRAISWKYQHDLIEATPRPKNWIRVRFEDFVLRQGEELARLAEFLGFGLEKVPVSPEPVGRWKKDGGVSYYDFLGPAMDAHGYEEPEGEYAGL